MPDPYLKARRSRLEWVAEYLDQELCQEEDVLTFNNQEGPLALASAPYLGPGEELKIALRRSDKVCQVLFKLQITRLYFQSTPTLESITSDNLTDEELDTSEEEMPRLLKLHLKSLNRTKENISRNSMSPCNLCDEIHLFNLRARKLESSFVTLR